MSWNIAYTSHARQDLRDIYSYISKVLQAPDTATGQVRRIMSAVRELDELPLRFGLYRDEPWHSRGIRFFPVDNYLIFFMADKDKQSVNILRIMYGGRDVGSQLEELR